MDRISALRNVEDALRAFENGEADLDATERRVETVLRTYATEFDVEERRAYRAVSEAGEGRVVVAGTPEEAREHVAALADVDPDRIEVEPI